MKVYIQTDIEGIAGFCFFENRKDSSIENFHHRQRMRRLLTGEVNAAVQAAYRAGATDVIVNDNHGAGYNIIFEELDPRCRIIHGRNGSGPHWLPLFTECDVMVLVGMHAMGGTPVSITPHSLWKVNDGALYLSEASMAAAIAGDHGIPVVFASGDDKIIAELTAKMPQLATVVTKQALAPFLACSLIPARACALIGETVERALKAPVFPAPYVIPGPVRLTLLDSANHAPPLEELRPPVTASTIEEAFIQYEHDMPWNCSQQQLPDGFVYP